ncbi:MAG: ATP-dependent RNA helicase DbpA [Bacteriovorax sp. MedPE-SWde]|nr:MAG: ATP-dependent RNA helicase DbpA [Bacteriovorax sp. MedPE-SWde]
METKFENLELKSELLTNLKELKYETMTPIQAQGLPFVLDGRDVIGRAKTGSGKTAAFALGILNSLDTGSQNIHSLVLCPTRELADQVATETRKLARMLKNVKVMTICGGTSEYHQEKSLSHGAHIIVGTPGRVLRLLKKKTLNLSLVNTFVLDEADRMLDMGFHDDIMHIATYLPKVRQTLLFSATYPEDIQKLGEKVQKDAEHVKVDTDHEENTISQMFFELQSHKDKNDAVLKILDKYRPDRFIIFCKTKIITDQVAAFLNKNGIYAGSIHGDLMQNERTVVMTMFANRSLSALVATDVAARGLDIQGLAAVINYDLPSDPEVYVHRVGRTGRAGETGLAFSLYVEQEHGKLDAIEDYSNKNIKIEDISAIEVDSQYDLIPEMKTMYISGGKKDKLRPGDILGALVNEAKLESADVGDINIMNVLSYVAIKEDKIEQAISKLRNGRIKNRRFRVGHA